MNSREMIGEFRSLRQALSGRLDSATLSLLIAGISAPDHALRPSQKLCHNCDTKPILTVKTDFIDGTTLLTLLKTKVSTKISPRHNFRSSRADLANAPLTFCC
jgi:hypothetical protein